MRKGLVTSQSYSRAQLSIGDELKVLTCTTRLAAALIAASLLVSCGGGAEPAAAPAASARSAPAASGAGPVETYSPAGPPRPEARAKLQAARAALGSAPRFALPPLPETAKAASAAPETGRQLAATGRDMPGTADAATFSARLEWKPRAGGGQQAVVLLASEGAAGLRAGVRVDQAPEGASLRFFAPGGTDEHVVPVTGGGGQMVWSPYLGGDQLALEVNLPAGADASRVRIAVPRLSHFSRAPLAPREGEETTRIGEGASCNVDAMCYAQASPEMNSVARILFTDAAGDSYLCSGTLLADRQASRTPYFLTANHCVSTPAEAASVQTYWFYRSPACNVFALSQQTITRTGGATLLHASEGTDSSFMVLNQAPPDGAAFAGWMPSMDVTTASMIGLHHPHGDLLKAAFGTFRAYKSCGTSNAGILNCSNASESGSNFFDVVLSTGTMEMGSSGSGVFATPPGSASKYLAGQLYGGSSSCTNRSGTNIYGRFDRTYQAVNPWLESAGDVTPQNGIWWNPAESGRGFAIDKQGDRIALGAYMYETSGVATWYLAILQKRANGTYAGEMIRYAGGQPLAGAYRAPSSSVKIADAVLVFSSPTNGWLKVQPPGGVATTIQLARFAASGGAPAVSAETGLWWNEAESGRGYVIEVQGSQLLFSAYAYAESGQSTWYLTTGSVSGQSAGGALQQYVNGQSLQGNYRAPVVSGSPGTAQITFTGTNRANLTLPNGQVVPIKRFTF